MRRLPRDAVVTVGVFDGLHLAHQQLLRHTVRLARRLQRPSLAITFDPDPQQVLHPAQAQPALMPLSARVEQLSALGIGWTWVIPFTRSFARLTAEQFIRQFLAGGLRARAVVVGEAFAFGRDRRGDMAVLRRAGEAGGLRVQALREVRLVGAPISSSRIRRLITGGQLAQAGRLLGRPPALYGVVVRGVGRGRRLGFPTANLRLTSQVLPPRGVYAVVVRGRGRRPLTGVTPPPIRVRGTRTVAHGHIASGELIGGGVMNIGVRPTFGPGPVVCEVHLLSFSGTLLGEAVCVSLLSRLRGERCFPSWEALRRQVSRDIARARALFARSPALR